MKGRILKESLREAKPLFKKLIPTHNRDIYSYHGEALPLRALAPLGNLTGLARRGDTGGEVGI